MKKLLSTTIAASLFASMSISPVLADVLPGAIPSWNSSANNQLVEVTTPTDTSMNIKIDPVNQAQYAVGKAYFNSFDIGSDAHVNVEFTAHNQTSLNYVDAAGGQSQIFGKFTDSGCNGCGYASTGKVILINPNGVMFGNGANVNLNSFTASTFSGDYDQSSNTLSLTRTGSEKNGIIVEDGAKIYGDKNVSFAAENIDIYKNSQITTSTKTLNVDTTSDHINDTALSKVKLVTSDGVNFKYYNSGAVDKLENIKSSADQMRLWVAGDITSGHIEVRNASTHSGSEINTNGATLKAYKAETGSDGNIWLVAKNRVVSGDTKFITENAFDTDAVKAADGGHVVISSGKKTTVAANSSINAVGDVLLRSSDGHVNADYATITANDITLDAYGDASIQNGSEVNGNNLLVKGGSGAQIVGYGKNADNETVISPNKISAKTVTIDGEYVWLNNSTVKATDKISGKANNDYVLAEGNVVLDAPVIDLKAATDITGGYDLTNNKATLTAGNDIDVTLTNVGNRDNGLVAEAGRNVTINTPGTLSASRLVATNGDMTLNAADIISGNPTNNIAPETKFAETPEDRALIWVKNGTFTTNPAMEVTKSGGDTIVKDKITYDLKHNIQYNNGAEKFLLINPRVQLTPATPVIPAPVTPASDETPVVASQVAVDDSQATSRTKIPQTLEVYDNTTNISDNRTAFVDVYAAASQIEIDE